MTSTHALNESRVGACQLPDGSWQFQLWAPYANSVKLHLVPGDELLVHSSPDLIAMEPVARGYHRAIVHDLTPGRRYFYRLEDGRDLPDPASRFQPEGVHGPSALVDTSAFRWTDQAWKGRPLQTSVFYELHVGTFTTEGTFDALISQLPYLAELGITTVELMPIAQFPGPRNWGYDGVYEFAPQNSYGGPESLHRLVDAIHAHGLAAALDVVYNHLGPEGNYLSAFAPYFTDRYRTPWGQAVNFDGSGSDEVRTFFRQNALYWLDEYHFDALRLDAVHGIFDFSALHFLAELKQAVAELSDRLGHQLHLIAESDLNDSRILHDASHGGYALDGQWSDDFHHSVHALLTKEDQGYYEDFGDIAPLVSTLQDGWHYRGQYSRHRQRRHGNSPQGISPSTFVVCSQNHDQVGNRAAGDRLTTLLSFDALKLAAGITLLSPFTPLLFMGEEYGEPAPFQYFTSHGDPELVDAVRRGRRQEFAAFGWQEAVPDPQDEHTFLRSRLNFSLQEKEPHKTLLRFYKHLIHLRAELGIGSALSHVVRELGERQLLLTYRFESRVLAVVFNFAEFPVTLDVPELRGNWMTSLDSASEVWSGLTESATTEAGVPPFSRFLREDGGVDFISPRPELGLGPHSFMIFEQPVFPEVQ
jgi:maltooligosyltrehalose trehalohydrolase